MYGFWRLGVRPVAVEHARLGQERARDGDEHEGEERRDAAEHGTTHTIRSLSSFRLSATASAP